MAVRRHRAWEHTHRQHRVLHFVRICHHVEQGHRNVSIADAQNTTKKGNKRITALAMTVMIPKVIIITVVVVRGHRVMRDIGSEILCRNLLGVLLTLNAVSVKLQSGGETCLIYRKLTCFKNHIVGS